MNRFTKHILAAALTLCLAASLSACGGGLSKFDATKYVQGVLDENYLGKFDPDFLEMVEGTESEAEEIYLGNLEAESNVFASFFEIEDLSGELLDDTMALYKDIYAMSKYSLEPATMVNDETFAIQVTVEPIDIFHLVYEEIEKEEPTSPAVQAFVETYGDPDMENMTEAEIDALIDGFDAAYARMCIDLTREMLPKAGYMEPETVMVQVKLNSDDVWEIPNNDFLSFDNRVIDYNVG